MPVVGNRKAVIVAVLFSLFLLCPTLVLGFEPFPGNWVEVVRFEGKASTQTELFKCDFPQWRIRWEFTPSIHSIVMPYLVEFSVTTFVQEESSQDGSNPEEQSKDYVVNQIETIRPIKGGISIINDQIGNFYMKITTFYVDDYTIIVEQNKDSIPEFQSWTILPILAGSTLVIFGIRNKISKKWLK